MKLAARAEVDPVPPARPPGAAVLARGRGEEVCIQDAEQQGCSMCAKFTSSHRRSRWGREGYGAEDARERETQRRRGGTRNAVITPS